MYIYIYILAYIFFFFGSRSQQVVLRSKVQSLIPILSNHSKTDLTWLHCAGRAGWTNKCGIEPYEANLGRGFPLHNPDFLYR